MRQVLNDIRDRLIVRLSPQRFGYKRKVRILPPPKRRAPERDFERSTAAAMIQAWGWKPQFQKHRTIEIDGVKKPVIIDILVVDENNKESFTLFENKAKIANRRALREAVKQANTYARGLGLWVFVVAEPEGLWVYRTAKARPRLIREYRKEELHSSSANVRAVILQHRKRKIQPGAF